MHGLRARGLAITNTFQLTFNAEPYFDSYRVHQLTHWHMSQFCCCVLFKLWRFNVQRWLAISDAHGTLIASTPHHFSHRTHLYSNCLAYSDVCAEAVSQDLRSHPRNFRISRWTRGWLWWGYWYEFNCNSRERGQVPTGDSLSVKWSKQSAVEDSICSGQPNPLQRLVTNLVLTACGNLPCGARFQGVHWGHVGDSNIVVHVSI